MLRGSFAIDLVPQPPYDDEQGVTLTRMEAAKTFSGPLQATSRVHMLAARTPVPTSAAYVALERIEGELEGKQGTFVVAHLGVRGDGNESAELRIVPDSGTGELAGLTGKMTIEIIEGQHYYEIDYQL